jgi:hypothetical protein
LNRDRKTGIIRKTWTYFKKGKAEITFVLSIYNTVLIWWSLGNLNVYFKNIKIFIMLFAPIYLIISIIMGKYITRNVETTNAYINPFTQDSLTAGILTSEALMEFFDGNRNSAVSKLKQSIEIRERWIDKWLR